MSEIEDTETFPSGLRVLVVDADPTTLLPLERLLLGCHYQVTIRHRATDALSLLREKEGSFDLVLSEIHLPGRMHGLQLLEIIGLEMDLPVVVMSHDGRKDLVMKIIVKGACDYLLKPVRIEEIRVIWQHVVRKRRNNFKSYMLSKFLKRGNPEEHQQNCENDHEGRAIAMQGTKGRSQSSNHEKDIENQGHQDLITASPSLKKPRMVWTPELHDQFVAVVNHVGLKNAVPKKILELMNVPGLTRENIASHLQKYRLHLRRKNVNTQNKSKATTPIYLKNFGSDCSANNSNSQAYALSKQLESQCSVFSEVDSEKMSILAVGAQVDQQMSCYDNQGLSLESIHRRGQKSWCYDTAMIINPMPRHDHEILESEKDNFIVMQRLHQSPLRIEMIRNELGRDGAPLNVDHVDVAAASYVSLSVPSTMSSVEDETEAEDAQHASSFILNIGDSGYDHFCSRYEPRYFSC